MKKYVFHILALLCSWLLPIGIYQGGTALYEHYFSFEQIHGVSWGIFVHYLYCYGNAIGLFFSFLLFQWKKEMLLVPFALISTEVLHHFPHRPLRVSLMFVSISLGYLLLYILLSLLKEANHTQNEKNI